MLRVDPKKVNKDRMTIGTIGLPHLLNFEDKKYLQNGKFGGIFHKMQEAQNAPNSEEYQGYTNGCQYTINFDHNAVQQFRNMRFNKTVGNTAKMNSRPRYVNEIQSFDFKIDTLDIIFELDARVRIGMNVKKPKYYCQINVFETPQDLEAKIEMITNGAFNKEKHILKVKGILSYFFGTETLINFESVYECVIRKESLELEAEDKRKKSHGDEETDEDRVYFWTSTDSQWKDENDTNRYYENLQDFGNDYSKTKMIGIMTDREEMSKIITGNINEFLTIPLMGWDGLHQLLKFVCRDEVKIPKECIAEAFFDNSNEFEGLDEDSQKSLSRLSEGEIKTLKLFSDKVHQNVKEKDASEFIYILIETMILVGPNLVAKTRDNHIYIAEDTTKTHDNRASEFFDIYDMYLTNMSDRFQFSYLPKEARLGFNVWIMSTNYELICLGSAGISLFDQNGKLKQGPQELVLWPLKPFPTDISCYGCNIIDDEDNPRFTLNICLWEFDTEYVYGREPRKDKEEPENMYKFQKAEKVELFESRHQYQDDPNRLPIILKTVNW